MCGATYTSALPICLRGVYRDIFNFYFDARSLNRGDDVPRVRLWTCLIFGLDLLW
jgi:hypothetical protein